MENVTKLIIQGGGSGDYEEIPAGVYLARCYKMIELGTQKIDFQGKISFRPKILIYWEVMTDEEGGDVRMEDGKPFSVSKRYTASMNAKATLRKDLDAWRGVPFAPKEAEKFDITSLLDKFATIQISKNVVGDRTYTNIDRVMSTKRKSKGVNELVAFSINQPDMKLFDTFPDWLKDKINESKEWSKDKITDEDLADFDGVTSDELEKPNF